MFAHLTRFGFITLLAVENAYDADTGILQLLKDFVPPKYVAVRPRYGRKVEALCYKGSITIGARRELRIHINGTIKLHIHNDCLASETAKSVREFLDYFRAVTRFSALERGFGKGWQRLTNVFGEKA